MEPVQPIQSTPGFTANYVKEGAGVLPSWGWKKLLAAGDYPCHYYLLDICEFSHDSNGHGERGSVRSRHKCHGLFNFIGE